MEALARLERGLAEQAQRHAATDVTVQDLHATVVETRGDLIKTVEYLYSVCSLLIERTEYEQLERQALMGALHELTRSATIELDAPGERVLGGSFPASPAESVHAGVPGEARPSGWNSRG